MNARELMRLMEDADDVVVVMRTGDLLSMVCPGGLSEATELMQSAIDCIEELSVRGGTMR